MKRKLYMNEREEACNTIQKGGGVRKGKRKCVVVIILNVIVVYAIYHMHSSMAVAVGCKGACLHPRLMDLLIPGLVNPVEQQEGVCKLLESLENNRTQGSNDLPTIFLVSCMRCGSTWQVSAAPAIDQNCGHITICLIIFFVASLSQSCITLPNDCSTNMRMRTPVYEEPRLR